MVRDLLHPERVEQLRQVVTSYQRAVCTGEKVKLVVNFSGDNCSAQIEFWQL